MKHFNDGVLEVMLQHCNSKTEVEVGGLLIGSLFQSEVRVVATLPALEAAAGTANVTFTHEVWDSALSKIEEDYPELQIVGWYHTHPRFGIFMSSYDQFIQQNFFTDSRLLGVVIDQIEGKGGTFQFINGDVTLTDSFDVTPVIDTLQSKVEIATRRRESRSKWSFLLPAILLFGLLFGFLLGGAGNQGTLVTNQTSQSSIPIGSKATQCVVTVNISYGTTYWSLAALLLNNGSLYKTLQEQTHSAPLHPGEKLKLTIPSCNIGSVSNG